MKFHRMSPFLYSQLAIFFRPSDIPYGTFMSVYYCTFSCWSIFGQSSHVPWNNRVCLLFHDPLLASLVKPSNFHRNIRSCLLQHVLPLAAPSDVHIGTALHSIGQHSSRCCQEIFPETYLNPPFPQPFLLPQLQSSIFLQISPKLLKPSQPHGISCSLNFKRPLLFVFVSTPNQLCSLQCEPFRVFSS